MDKLKIKDAELVKSDEKWFLKILIEQNLFKSTNTILFPKLIISFPNGDILEGVVQYWANYSDTDRLQIKIDGKTYLVHSANCVLIAE